MNEHVHATPTQATTGRLPIAETIASGFILLKFPAALERLFRARHAAQALDVINRMLPWVTLLYVAAALVMYLGASEKAFAIWIDNALWPVAAGLAWLWIARFTGLLARNVHLHTGTVLAVALFASVRTIFVLGNEPGVVYVTYQVIYLLFIAFTVAQLRMPLALLAMVLAGVAVVVDTYAEHLVADWLAFGQYFVATTLISAVIGYIMEHRERHEWLKSEQSALEKQEMLALQARAAVDAQQQRILGKYLELVAGNLTATEIAGRSLKFLVEHMHAQIGTVFLADEGRLRRAASWGLDGETRTADELGRGETLIGQAAEDGRRLRLTHLPADYHPITTATGSASPAELLVEPVRFQGTTLAVLELGALQAFGANDIALIDHVVPALAGTLVAANARDALARAGMADFAI